MKRILGLFLAMSLIATSFASGTSLILPKKKTNANEVYVPIGKNGQRISLMELSKMKVKDYEAMSGAKLKLVDKIGFKVMQKQLSKSINADGTINNKKMETLVHKGNMSSDSHHYLRLTLIFLALAIGLGIIGYFVPFVWILSGIAGLAAAIFFVLWLINMSNTM